MRANMRALSLSDYQMQQLRAAAKTLLPSARSDFLEGVARRLGDQPSDEALQIANRYAIIDEPAACVSLRRKQEMSPPGHHFTIGDQPNAQPPIHNRR
jgi:hypothetical protein